MKFVTGRVYASSPDEAAIRIRDKHQEYEGELTILGAWTELDWYEYLICLTGEDG